LSKPGEKKITICQTNASFLKPRKTEEKERTITGELAPRHFIPARAYFGGRVEIKGGIIRIKTKL